MQIEHCKKCGKIRFKGKWLSQSEELLKDFVRFNIKPKELKDFEVQASLEPQKDNTTTAEAKISGKIDGEKISFSKKTLLKPLEALCDSCMRLGSNYFEATIQLRFGEKAQRASYDRILSRIDLLLSAEEKSGDALARRAGIEKLSNGINVLVGSRKAAKKVALQLARENKTGIVASFSLAGIDKSGNERKRYAFLVRLP
jgi:NMD protein affecting ribosome stability and mRNA decay